MGLLDRFRINKAAPLLPNGAQTYTAEQVAAAVNAAIASDTFRPLPRDYANAGIPFGPSVPLTPAAINPLNEDGRTAPRRMEYPVSWNIFTTEQRLVPWKVLRASAEQIDVLRRCIEVLKSKVISMDWDIVIADGAAESIMSDSGNSNYLRAMSTARQQFAPEVSRLRQFWSMPDRINGLTFAEWLSMALEELLVLDALSIYGRKTLGNELHSFEIIDGSTIKPLLDGRGMRPQPPYPAYQQILYGFPRGEFTATSDSVNADGEYSADELVYLVRNRRTWTPYGFSPVERSLPLADIYLRRQQWLRSEFTDGVSPDLFFRTSPEYGSTPELLRAWETIFNDDMAGQTQARRGGKLLPSGFDPVDMSGRTEKFSATIDEYLIKGITGHFGVLPSEIGFTPQNGLGGAGHQEGEAETASVVGVGPLTQWLGAVLSDLSYKFLGMPRELEFRFDGGRTSESAMDAQRRATEVSSGQRTLNEARSEMGLPLLDSSLADMPRVVGFPAFLSPEGLITSTMTTEVGEDGAPQLNVAAQAALESAREQGATESEMQRAEVAAFIKWASKGKRNREFMFKHVDSVSADALNHAAKYSTIDEVRSVAAVVAPFYLSAEQIGDAQK